MFDIKEAEIIVDSREPPDTLKLLQRYCPKARKEKLEVFDIVYKNLGFELESFFDLVGKIKSNRYRNQLNNIKLTCEASEAIVPHVIVWGNQDEIKTYSKIRPEAVIGAIASILGGYNFKYANFLNKLHAIYGITKIIEKTYDEKDRGAITYKTHKMTVEQQVINVIRSCAGRFSENAAINALTEYKTIKTIVNLSVDDLKKIYGIGDKIAKEFYKVVNHDFSDPQIMNGADAIEEDIEPELMDNDASIDINDIADPIPADFDMNVLDVDGDKEVSCPPDVDFIRLVTTDDIKEEIFQMIKKSGNKTCSLDTILDKIDLNNSEVKSLLRDLELESRVYQADTNKYLAY